MDTALAVEAPAPMLKSSAQFHYSAPHGKEQLARWQASLEQRVPRTRQLSWLYLRWEAGDIWQPIQRYVIWEMVPDEVENEPGVWKACVPRDVRVDLDGPSPRSTGHYDPVRKAWMGGAGESGWVDLATWQVYRETERLFGHKQWGLRYYAIQGEAGGHPLHEPFVVRMVNRIRRPNAPETQLPAIGDLPYAEPSDAVFDRIGGYDKYRKWRMLADWGFRNHEKCSQEDRKRAEEAAAEATAWWDSQIDDVMKEVGRKQLAEVGWQTKGASAGNDSVPELTDELTRQQLVDLYVSKS